jgi:hypothetical protein
LKEAISSNDNPHNPFSILDIAKADERMAFDLNSFSWCRSSKSAVSSNKLEMALLCMILIRSVTDPIKDETCLNTFHFLDTFDGLQILSAGFESFFECIDCRFT